MTVRPDLADEHAAPADAALPPDLADEHDVAVSADPELAAVRVPELPPARTVDLPGGPVELREVVGPPGAAAVFLLHGWTATADLNFFRCYAPLGQHHRVLAFDHRGHGTGLRGRRAFRLEDCADDVVAMADALGLDQFVAFGYSMGGAVAQLLAQRHRERLAGLVLVATASHFKAFRNERLSFLGLSGLAALARLTPAQARRWLTDQLYRQRKTGTWEPWAVQETAEHDWRMVLEAGRAIGRFRADAWLGELDVPTAVIVTMKDEVVPVRRQIALFEAIPTAVAFRVDAGHDAAVAAPDRFVPASLAAIASVVGSGPAPLPPERPPVAARGERDGWHR